MGRNYIFAALLFPLLVLPASAQETGVSEMENTSESMIETMIVVGSRTQNRSSEEMTVPVDTLDQELLGSQS